MSKVRPTTSKTSRDSIESHLATVLNGLLDQMGNSRTTNRSIGSRLLVSGQPRITIAEIGPYALKTHLVEESRMTMVMLDTDEDMTKS